VERRCGSIHAEGLARSADPEVRGFFASLAKQDVRHERLLEQALQS
jgi:rubrerythrin